MDNHNIDWWNEISLTEENDLDDELINRLLRWTEINKNLNGIETILDIGGATGVFSIPLANMGFKVTHVDISSAMLDIAIKKAENIKNIKFIQADAKDLSFIPNQSFDLVLNFDGPISFSGYDWKNVIDETCRVTKKKLIITVSNKACMIPTWVKYSLKATNKILPAVYEMLNNGFWHKDQFEDNNKIYGNVCNITSLKAFSSDELSAILKQNNMNVIKSRSLGSLAYLYLLHTNEQEKNNYFKDNLQEFIQICEQYDEEIMPEGPGTFRRAGIIAVAHPNVI